MILARSCKIVATSLAVCKILEAIYKIFLQDVSEFVASLPAMFLQEVYVWDDITVQKHETACKDLPSTVKRTHIYKRENLSPIYALM